MMVYDVPYYVYQDWCSARKIDTQPHIPEEQWGGVMTRACDQLNRYLTVYSTDAVPCNRGGDEWEEVGGNRLLERAVCEMAEVFYAFDCAGAASDGVASVSVGSVSESYGKGHSSVDYSYKALQRALYAAANRCLNFYRGVD